MLHIRTEYRSDGPNGAGWYSDGICTSGLFEQTYGYFECRCKLPAAQGLWSAFWLTRSGLVSGKPGTEGTEIDVFESPMYNRKGDNKLITSNLHYNGYGAAHRFHNVGFFKVKIRMRSSTHTDLNGMKRNIFSISTAAKRRVLHSEGCRERTNICFFPLKWTE